MKKDCHRLDAWSLIVMVFLGRSEIHFMHLHEGSRVGRSNLRGMFSTYASAIGWRFASDPRASGA
jgi:hypothetical protein